jgi:plasmid stabilization system protein ParE
MPDTTPDSDRILREAKTSLAVQRDGGTHRPGPRSIGRGSAAAKRKVWIARARNLAIAIAAIWIGAGIAGAMFSGIGFWGLMAVVVATCIAVGVFSSFPKVKVPKRAELALGNPAQMVARTELWLEAQRPALPAPAQALVDRLGAQLDALGVQLQGLDGAHPAMAEVRELVGEYIPETIDNYRKVPANLRAQLHVGKTADARLVESLTKLSAEVDRVTGRLAEGALDDLAIKSRYLEYRYGGDEALAQLTGNGAAHDTGVPLPDFTVTPAKQER